MQAANWAPDARGPGAWPNVRSGESLWKRLAILAAIAFPVLMLVAIGILDFQSWPQVDDLWAFRFTLDQVRDHPHFYRYLVIYPGFLASEWGGPVMVSLYIGLFCAVGLFIVRQLTLRFGLFVMSVSMAIYAAPHFFMNGRGAISWAAWALGILVLLRAEQEGWRWKHAPLAAAAMLGSATTTGVFAVVFGSFFASQFVGLFRANPWRTLLILIVPVGYFAQFFYVALDKNLTYFEGGTNWALINMLDHGWGRLVEQSRVYAGAAVFAGILLPFFVYYLRKRLSLHETIVVVAPVVGGAFGFTTLTLIVPSIATVLVPKLLVSRGRPAPARIPTQAYWSNPV